jgi:Na+-driven multidrug efflux pump
MIVASDTVYELWIGTGIKVSKGISIGIGIFVIINILALPYNAFINGTGKIKLQYYASIFAIVFTIPLSIFFVKFLHWGTFGIIAATLFTTIPCAFLWKIQFEKIINRNAIGIWNK